MVTGEVASFDEERGWGVIRRPDAPDLPFHCTAIADGTRQVAQGAAVVARMTAGHNGRWEAAEVVTVPHIDAIKQY